MQLHNSKIILISNWFSGELTGMLFYMHFVFIPGNHMPSGPQIIHDVRDVNTCAKRCFFDNRCVAFHYYTGLCTLYRSLNRGRPQYLFLWIKKSALGEPVLIAFLKDFLYFISLR